MSNLTKRIQFQGNGKRKVFALLLVLLAATGTLSAQQGLTVSGTVHHDKTGEAINVTLTKVAKDGTLTVEVDGYGKGKLVEMTVADYLALEELLK